MVYRASMLGRMIAVAPVVFALLAASPAPKTPKPDAREIDTSALVIDTHADTPQRFLDERFDVGTVTPVADGHMDLQKIRAGNLGAEFFSIWVDPNHHTRYAHRALQLIDAVYEQTRRHAAEMTMAFSAADILAARQGPNKKLAVLMGVEGGHAIEDDLGILRDFYRLGVRYMTLTWSNTNEWAASSGDLKDPKIAHHNGLTDFGKDVVREMNRLGMMVDISHVSDKTFWDALEVSSAPIFASHSSARALSNVPRNMTDEMIAALAKKGGVVQINFSRDYLSQATADADKEVTAKIAAARAENNQAVIEEYRKKIPRATLADVAAHIDHIVKIAGINAAGIGSDFDGVSCTSEGLDDVSKFPNLTRALLEKGYSAEDIRKIYGGNTLA